MSSGANYDLGLLLTYKDRASAGIDTFIIKLRSVKREAGGAAAAIERLQRATLRTGRSGGRAPDYQREARTRVSAEANAAREIERITRQGTRQADQQSRLRERAARSLASVQVREQKRVANELIKTIQLQKKAERPPPRYGGSGGISGGRVAGLATGVAGGAYLAKGYRDSTSKEDALANLRSVVTKVEPGSGVNRTVLDDQMARFTQLGTELGNKLPGNFMQYIDQAATLKQRGLEVGDILGGAGKSAAYLSASNRADPQETARDVATFGQIYGLKGREYEQSTDLLSRIKTAKDLDSGELIEASKYFQGRAGTPLGLKGLKGADESTRFLAFMRQKTGLEGSAVGTASGTFLTNLIKKPKEVEKLSKATGVDLSAVDQSGKFIGIERLIEKFTKLDGKLTNEQQVQFGGKIAGEEGSAIFSAMVSKGKEYGEFNEQINSVLGMMEKADIMTGTTSAKLEALKGTYENLNAEIFTEMTKALDPLLDKTNTFLGHMQGVAAQHSGVAAVGAGILGIGTAAAGSLASVGSLAEILQLLKGGGGGGGGGAGGGSIGGTGVDFSDIITGGWAGGRVLKGVGGSVVRGGIGVLGGPAGIAAALGLAAYNNYQADADTTQKENRDASARFEAAKKLREEHGGRLPDEVTSRLGVGLPGVKSKSLLTALEPKTGGLVGYAGVGARPDLHNRTGLQAGELRRRLPELQFPELMKRFVQDTNQRVSTGEVGKGYGERVLKIAEMAFPDSFKQASTGAAEGIAQLIAPTATAADTFAQMLQPAGTLPVAFGNVGSAASLLAARLSNIQVAGYPVCGGGPGSSVPGTKAPATGFGFNYDKGSTATSPPPRLISSARPGGMQIGSVNINVPAGAAAANDPQVLAEFVAQEIGRQAPHLLGMVNAHLDHRIDNGFERSNG